jgi:hypothetical protein
MDPTTYVFLILVALIAANQVVLRVATLRRNPIAFWGLQAINLALASWILVWGIPGFETYPIVSWILGLLLLFRMIQNNLLRARFLRAAVQEEHQEEKRQRARRMADQLAEQERGDADEGSGADVEAVAEGDVEAT